MRDSLTNSRPQNSGRSVRSRRDSHFKQEGFSRAKLQLRDYKPNDLDTLVQIDSLCFPLPIAYTKENLSRYLRRRSALVFLAEYFRQIIGFVLALHYKGRKRIHLVTLDVIPPYQGRGVGRRLLNAVLEKAQSEKVESVHLEVASNNRKAIELYLTSGFRIAERLKNYYADSRDGLSMVLSLQVESPNFKCDSRENQPIMCGVFDPD